MESPDILNPRVNPTIDNLQRWNAKPVNDESVVDVEYIDPRTKQKHNIKLPFWVKFAIEVRYVIPGFSLQNYLWAAISGFEGDKVKRAGFNLVAVANEMGVGKSNLSLQFQGQVYGEEHAGEWQPDWDMVLKYKILNREEIIPTWKKAKDEGRIKCLLLDDIDSIFSKELWFEDRPLYIKLRKAINLIRPRVSNFIVTAPSLNDILTILSTKITFEVMPFPNQTYMVERYCRFIDQFSTNTNFFRKIETEYSRFNLGDLPHSIYKEYDASRAVKEEEEMNELEQAMIDSVEKRKEKKENKEIERSGGQVLRNSNRFKCANASCGYVQRSNSESGPPRCTKCGGKSFTSYSKGS